MVDLTKTLLKEKKKILKESIDNAICFGGEDLRREHLGMSMIGDSCYRKLFMKFRWFDKQVSDNRLKRVFNLGHIIEDYIVSCLKEKYKLWYIDSEGNQFSSEHEFNKFFSGSWDGVLKIQDEVYLLEIKSYNNTRFNKLKKEKVKSSDYKYYVQMQCYMYEASKKSINNALFIAYNKNTSEIYTEVVEYDNGETYNAMSIKANSIVNGKLIDFDKYKPTYYECKMCEFNEICHKGKGHSLNCRTCIHSEPLCESGEFVCNLSHAKNNDYKAFEVPIIRKISLNMQYMTISQY